MALMDGIIVNGMIAQSVVDIDILLNEDHWHFSRVISPYTFASRRTNKWWGLSSESKHNNSSRCTIVSSCFAV